MSIAHERHFENLPTGSKYDTLPLETHKGRGEEIWRQIKKLMR